MATYRIETSQGTFDIEADREPTQQEAMQAIAGNLSEKGQAQPYPGGQGMRESPLTREEARRIAGEEVVKRARAAGKEDVFTGAEIGRPDAMFATTTGIIPRAMAYSREFARNIPLSPSEPILEGAEQLASAVGLEEQSKAFGRERLAEANPMQAASGQLGSMAIPSVAVTQKLSKAPTALRLFEEGAQTGGIIGGSSQLSEAISEGASPGETLERTAEGTLVGTATGAGLGAIPSVTKKSTNIILNRKQTPQRILADLVEAEKATKNVLDNWQSGRYEEATQLLKSEHKGSGVNGLLDASESSLNKIADTVNPVVKTADAQVYLNKDDLISDVESRLSKTIAEPEARAAALEKVRRYINNVNPKNLVELSKNLNSDLGKYYRNKRPNEASDIIEAEKAVRDVFSGRIHRILQDNNVDSSIYSQSGAIAELQDVIGGRYRKESAAKEAVLGRGFWNTLLKQDPGITKTSLLQKTKTALTEFFGRGEAGRLDSQVDKLFKRTKTSRPIQELSEQERSLLLQRDMENQQRQQVQAERESLSASPEELREGGAATQSLSQMEKEYQSRLEAEALRKEVENQFPSAEEFVQREKAIGTPDDVDEYLQQQSKLESDLKRSAQKARLEREMTSGAEESGSLEGMAISRDRLKKIKSSNTEDILSDAWNNFNKGRDATLEITELQRRRESTQYKENWPEIDDALKQAGIPTPVQGSDLPRKREIIEPF